MTYKEKLLDPRWQKKRLKILERDGFMCLYCFDTDTTLHVHHLKYKKNPWDVEDEYLQTVCSDCHFIISDAEKLNKKYKYIIGDKHLNDDGTKKYLYSTFDLNGEKCIIIWKFNFNVLCKQSIIVLPGVIVSMLFNNLKCER